ncbi:amino acid adenylation domain-containing protein [Streptomyces nogalater]|uniref:Amino acid adenylation domain-containing protein n=1 Tax=Streptomyces nogalater TaxID=38314 RepID=A0ABW0WCG0_STRNO
MRTDPDVIEGYPLSEQQRRLWHLRGRTAEAPVARLVVDIEGPLHQDRLRAALTAVTARHEALRTRYVVAADTPGALPVQVVADEPTVRWDSEDARDGAVAAVLRRTGPDRHRLRITLPALSADAVSLSVIAADLADGYRGAELPEAVSYARFAAWQDMSAEEAGEDRPGPGDRPEPVGLAADGPRPATAARAFPVGEARAVLAPGGLDRTARLARDRGLALDSVVGAAWAVLLGRRTGRTDVVLGLVRDGRGFEELESVVGPTARVLPVTVDTSPGRRFADVAAELAAAAELFDEYAESGIWPAGADDVDGLLPLQFEWLPAAPAASAGEVTFTVVERVAATEPCDVRLVAAETADGVTLELLTGPDAAPAADDLAAALRTLLATLTDLDQDVAGLPCMGQAERDRLLGLPVTDHAGDHRAVHTVFHDTALAHPDAPALAGDGEGERLSYAELDALSNRVAHGLLRGGVRPGGRVGVRADRGADTVVALLAVLKAGCAFVPVDFEQPDELLSHVVREAEVDLVVLPAPDTTGRLDALGAAWADLRTLAEAGPDTDPAVPVAPDGLAYIVFTSGSTGWPKAVAVTHANLTHYTAAVAERLGFRPGWNHATIAAPSVDLGYTALFGALLTGGCFHPLDRDRLLDPRGFAELVRGRGLDCFKTTPSHFRALSAAGGGSDVFPRRLLILGGEALDPYWAADLTAAAGSCRVVNHYGPAETCVGAAAFVLPPDWRPGRTAGGSVPLGTGLGANRLLLLDAARRPVPAGVPGELYIAGPGVTRGYLGRDELTAERFLPDEAVPGGRIYRTGDMALLDGDGLPVFLYRTDEQTKIRGFRVEPAAVRARLAEHQAVEQAVVVARELADGDTGLVAYAVPTAAYCATLSPVLDRQQVGEWTEVFENVYDAGTSGDTLLDLTGWNSSYTGEEMTEQEIRESVDGIVGRVTALAPQSVLEVGCGTGLLLYRLAPGTRRYVGTDFSAEVLATLARTVEADPERFAPVSLQCREAADFRGFDDDSFDLVLLNSVVQYFPSAAYLRQVIGEAVRVVRPGGHVFVGDVRDLRLLEAFQLSVGIHQADDTATAGELLRQAAAAAEDEGELLLTPGYFAALSDELAEVAGLEVLLKRGRAANELSKFRFDVLLRVGARSAPPADVPRSRVVRTPAELAERLAAGERSLLLPDVPDGRTGPDVERWHAARAGADDRPVAGLRDRPTAPAPTPEDWWALEASHGVRVAVQPARSGRLGHCDVLVTDGTVNADWRPDTPATRPEELHNEPFRRKLNRELAQELRRFLADRLPEYAVPAHIVVMRGLPLMPNGKLDTARLPVPRTTARTAHVAPRTPLEEAVAGLWQDVLGVQRIGVLDDFFVLGGHSLLAVQTVYRIGEDLGVTVSLKEFFDHPTVAELTVLVAERMLAGLEPADAEGTDL